MSYSTDYCKHYLKNIGIDFSVAEERVPEKYFDQIMRGERERIADTPNGKIKISIDFDENADFNFVDSFGGIRFGFQDDLEDQIMSCVYRTLCDKAYVPFQDGKPIGGLPKNGDIIHVTFGNIVVVNTFKVNNGKMMQSLDVLIPKKYERIISDTNA